MGRLGREYTLRKARQEQGEERVQVERDKARRQDADEDGEPGRAGQQAAQAEDEEEGQREQGGIPVAALGLEEGQDEAQEDEPGEGGQDGEGGQ